MDLGELGLRLEGDQLVGTVHPWLLIDWRIRNDDTPTRAELLDAIRAHPDFGPAVADLLTKGKGKRGRRWKPDARWTRNLARVSEVSKLETEYRQAGKSHIRPIDRAIRDVADRLGLTRTTIEDDVRRVPPGAPPWVRRMHRMFREWGKGGE